MNTATVKILHSVRNMSHAAGGVTVAIEQLLYALQRQDRPYQQALTAHRSADEALGDHPAFEWYPTEESGFRAIHQQLMKLVSEQSKQIKLIHDHALWLPNNYSIAAAARKYNIPRVVSTHGMLEPWAFNFHAWKKRLAWYLFQKKVLQTAKVLHATSEQEARNLLKYGLGNPVAVIPLGVDMPPDKVQPLQFDKRVMLFLSRIQPKKGLINLVNAWDQIRDERWKIVIAGPDEQGHRAEVEALIHQKGLQESFEFTGNLSHEEKWPYYYGADVFVLPTHSENFGIVVVEALACGLPVVITKGAPWDVLEREKCGWWIDIGVKPLTSTLKEIVNMDPAQLKAIGQRGISLAREQFTWQRTANDMIALYEWMLTDTSEPKFVIR